VQVQHYITSQITIQSELIKDTVSSSMHVLGRGDGLPRQEGGKEDGKGVTAQGGEGEGEGETLPPLIVDGEEQEERKHLAFPSSPLPCGGVAGGGRLPTSTPMYMKRGGEGGREGGGEGGREGGGGLDALATEARILEAASKAKRQQQQDTLSSLEDEEEEEEEEQGEGRGEIWSGCEERFPSRPRTVTLAL
jgi:hypothetical protein